MFPLFDKFDESNFEVDNQEFNTGSRTLSTINKEYSQLGTLKTWPYGEQEADESLNILSRRYVELLFDEVACDFDFNDAGFEDDTFGGRYYWRVLHKLTEHEYYSENTNEFDNFLIWEESNHRFQMDIIYKHELIQTINWLRPHITVAATSSAEGGFTCPVGGSTPGDDNKTGDSVWITISSSNILNAPTCRQYKSVTIPYYKVFDVGGALGAVVSGDAPDNIYLFDIKPSILQTSNINIGSLLKPLLENVDYRSTTNPVTLEEALSSIMTASSLTTISNAGSFADPIRLRKRFLLLEYTDPEDTKPQGGKVELYGEEFYRSFLPLTRDLDPLFPEHPPGTAEIPHTGDNITVSRYKPPNRLDFPDNFWNDINVETIESYGSRVGLGGQDTL